MKDEKNQAEIEEEEYLYHYQYMIDGEYYNYLDYFKNQQEAEETINHWNKGAPYILTISIKECKEGFKWKKKYMPYTRSEWKKLHNWQE